MRDPFQLPEGCDPVEFDLDMGADPLPICSLPPFTQATVVTPDIYISLPFAPPPWNCFTIPTHQTVDFSPPKIGVPELRVSVRIKPAPDYDACDPSLVMSIDTSLPCLPLAVSGNVEINMIEGSGGCSGYTPPDPSGELMLTMVAPCDLIAELDLNIPCIAFTPEFNVNVREGEPDEPPQGSGEACVEGCDLILNLDLVIPRVSFPSMSCPLGSLGLVVNYTNNGNDEGSAHGTIVPTDDCGFDIVLDIDFPHVSIPSFPDFSCPVNAGTVSVIVTQSGDDPPTAGGEITITEDCEIDLKIDITIPEFPEMPSMPSCPVEPGTVSVVVTQSGDDPPTANGEITIGDDCTINLRLDITIPSGPSIIMPSMPSCACPSMEYISDVRWDAGIVIERSQMHRDCTSEVIGTDVIEAVECPPKKK